MGKLSNKVALVTGSSRGIGAAIATLDQKQAFLERHPIPRLGTPDDVARAALYLASDDAAWITGVVFDVAGGAVML